MSEILYKIKDEYGRTIASHMNVNTALILIKAYFNEYYADEDIKFTIEKMELTQGDCEAVNE